ncbi:hypothetical protein IG631_12633 [Alternaria alternata]|nr:hypothetical protein IG631_12633 [Alternaria alternata]
MSLLAAHTSRVGPRTMWASKDITLTSSYSLLLTTSEVETAIDESAVARAFKGGKTVRRVLLARLRAAVRAKTCHPTNTGPPPQSSLRSVLNSLTNPSTRYSNRTISCRTTKLLFVEMILRGNGEKAAYRQCLESDCVPFQVCSLVSDRV